jgi:NADP-dependent 3-hydroxy acid dehydrogenase YdfG
LGCQLTRLQGFATAFAKAGAKAIVLVARNVEKLKEVAVSLKALNPNVETMAAGVDIADADSIANLYEKISSKYGHADVLVNNAGLNEADGTIKEIEPKLWMKDFVSLIAPYLSYFPFTNLPTFR